MLLAGAALVVILAAAEEGSCGVSGLFSREGAATLTMVRALEADETPMSFPAPALPPRVGDLAPRRGHRGPARGLGLLLPRAGLIGVLVFC